MSFRKAALIAAAVACAVVFLPLTRSFADGQQPMWQNKKMEPAYCISGADEEQGETPERLAALQIGDTILLDNAGNKIGTLRVDESDGTLLLVTGEYKDGTPAKVLYGATEEVSGQWLKRIVGADSTSSWLLYVSVAFGDAYSTKLAGWIDTAHVQNFPGISLYMNNAPLLEQIETLNQELELAQKSPLPTNTPAPTQQAPVEKFNVLDILRDPLFDLAIDVLILFVSIFASATILLQRKEQLVWDDHETERHKRDVKDSLTEADIPSTLAEIKTTGREVEKLTRTQLEKLEKQQTPGGTRPEPPRVLKDWEELAAIAQSVVSETSFANWEYAFRSKNWLPQGIQPSKVSTSGEFEIAGFDRTQSIALFAPRDPEEKGRYYLIPSIMDSALCSDRVSDFFNLREEKFETSEPYRIIKPAFLHTLNDRHFKLLFKGEIRVPSRSQE